MNDRDKEFFDKLSNPIYQGIFLLVLALLIIVFGKIFNAVGLIEVSNLFSWLINTSFILLFAMMNAVLSLYSDNQMKYWSYSLYSFMGFLVASGAMAFIFSGVGISEAATYKWLFFMLTIIYLVFIAIVRLMRFIVDLAQKQDKRLRNESD